MLLAPKLVKLLASVEIVPSRFFLTSTCNFKKKSKDSAASSKNTFINKDYSANEINSELRDSRVSKKTKRSFAENQISRGEVKQARNDLEIRYKGEIVHGIYPVYLALTQGKRKFYRLFVKESKQQDTDSKVKLKDEIRNLAGILGINIETVNSHTMNRLAPGAVHQGVCLDASPYKVLSYGGEESGKSEQLDGDSHSLWLILDGVGDPMNVGAIFRSAYYFGVDKILLTATNCCRLSPTVSKASSGTLEVLDIFEIHDLLTLLMERKEKGWCIVSTVACKDTDGYPGIINLADFKLSKPTILILGNEGKGIQSSVQPLCDHLLSILPSRFLYQGIDSLNVSVATGVILYHLLYGRNSGCKQSTLIKCK